MKLHYPALILLILASHSVYAEQACNAKITNTTPGQQFTVNGQEITDKKTGLTWQKCTLGQSGNDSTKKRGKPDEDLYLVRSTTSNRY